MAKSSNDKPVTKREVKEIVTGVVSDAVDKVLKGVDRMFTDQNKKIDGMDKRLGKVETDIVFIKRDTRDIKVELSDTVSRREHEELKARVDKYHPAS